MRNSLLKMMLTLALAFLTLDASAEVISFTNRTAFVNALAPGYFEDTFSDVTNGGITGASNTRSGNGFSVTYSASPNGLFSATGAMSTAVTTDNLLATMGSAPVYAAGGYFYLTDLPGDYQAFPGAKVSAFASNGSDPISTLESNVNSLTNFFGWISSTPLVSITMNSGGTSPDRWNTIDDFIVGDRAAVPEIDPAGMGSVLALVTGALGLLERRRLKAADAA